MGRNVLDGGHRVVRKLQSPSSSCSKVEKNVVAVDNDAVVASDDAQDVFEGVAGTVRRGRRKGAKGERQRSRGTRQGTDINSNSPPKSHFGRSSALVTVDRDHEAIELDLCPYPASPPTTHKCLPTEEAIVACSDMDENQR